MPATYHNHSTFSDGKGAIPDLVRAAVEMEVDEVGISDHLTLHPNRRISWSMQPSQLGDYAESIRRAREAANGRIHVRMGLELDWFEGREDLLARTIESHPFDYIIGSVHFVGLFAIDGSPQRWSALSQGEIDAIHREYWVQVRRMAESGLFDIAAHLDLPKKFGYLPSAAPAAEIEAALDALAAHSVAVELNTAGWHKACAEAYPSRSILEACRRRNIPSVISADAHDPAHLLRGFDEGRKELQAAGYTETAWFKDRVMTLRAMDC